MDTDLGFGHSKARADLAFQQRHQPVFLLGICAVAYQHLHVASVWGRAIEDLEKATMII